MQYSQASGIRSKLSAAIWYIFVTLDGKSLEQAVLRHIAEKPSQWQRCRIFSQATLFHLYSTRNTILHAEQSNIQNPSLYSGL